MAQKKKPVTPQPVPAQPVKPKPFVKQKPKSDAEPAMEEELPVKSWSIYDFKVQAIIVALLGFIFYINTYKSEYAHDDGIVIVKNEYVLEGFAGIPGILTKDAYDSYYRQLNTTNQLAGGRFRPLSIISFAIEQQFFGAVPPDRVDSVLKQNISYGVRGPQEQKLVENMHVRHLWSVFWYVLSVIALLYFLRYIIFRRDPMMAFIAAIIFTIHPIHTEVVANVKSRDEIMSLLFMCLTFIFSFKHYEKKKLSVALHAAIILPIFACLLYLSNMSEPTGTKYLLGFLGAWLVFLFILKNGKKSDLIDKIENGFKWAIGVVTGITLLYLLFAYRDLTPEHKEVTQDFFLLMLGLICAWLLFLFFLTKEKRDNIIFLLLSLFAYFLAFLSKEYAITLAVLLPLSLYLFYNFSIQKSIFSFLPFIAVFVLYLLMRYYTLQPVSEGSSSEVLNNPYFFASGTEKLATEISTCLRYIKLLLWPSPLSADYSYNTIPYVDFSAPMVWVSFIIHGSLVLAMIAFFIRSINPDKPSAFLGINLTNIPVRNARVLCFGLAFYFIHFILVCNIIFDIGATMGERLIYHSSVGFAICVALLLVKGAGKIKSPVVGKVSLTAFMLVIIVLSGFKTVQRNSEWVNDASLFGADLKTVPNSVLVSANVAASYITISDYAKNDSLRKDYLVRAVNLLDHTLSIHRTFVAAFLNRGIAWYKLGNLDKAKLNMDTVRSLYPTYPVLPGMYKLISDSYGKNGWENYGKRGLYPQAIAEFKKGLAIDGTNADLWYNLGGAYFSNKQYSDAGYAWQNAVKYNPNNQNARQGLIAVQQALQGKPVQMPQQAPQQVQQPQATPPQQGPPQQQQPH